jgi:hypothetical protein
MSEQTLDGKTLAEWKAEIDAMSHSEMARLWRHAPIGHPIFRRTSFDGELFDYFQQRFNDAGGMTPGISKKIGWDDDG